MDSTVSPRARRKAQLCRDMLAVVHRQVVDGHRFSEVSVEQLAAGAGVSRATFYVYFRDRADFLQQAAATVVDELTQAGSLWWGAVESGDLQALRQAMRALIAVYRAHEGVLTAVAEAEVVDPVVAQDYKGLMDGAVTVLDSALRRGARAGVLRPLPAHTAAALIWMVERGCAKVLSGSPTDLDDDLADTFTEIIAAVVYSDATPQSAAALARSIPA